MYNMLVSSCGLEVNHSSFVTLQEFYSGFSGFPPSTKTNISKCQFDQDKAGLAWKPTKSDVAYSLNIATCIN